MTHRFVVTGTDTGIGKTIFSAALTDALGACYWKPVQSGLDEETDSETVQRLGRIPSDRILPEVYRLNTPVSPHLSARIDGVEIRCERLSPPAVDRPLVIEGAGGLMVPLTERTVYADVFARWQMPVILCARTGLGTINHTLLSLEALARRAIPVFGVAFIGDEQADSEAVISQLGAVRRLGRLPRLDPLTPDRLRQAFRENFDITDFREVPA
ncbi:MULTISPECIES: dethiobiotin synthase [unclassified Ensifer]|uniref:dethiobiotin synthase n=1 Tax=unclassified Ensifer TaxID=2633371 RepID=UPI000813912E|nr:MULTISPECIES: dethiobiotin synthase [unclassified Ensifer]OCO99973.1 dethiobiotin synthase [Ensifer sp. LC13]OCP00090.1 dethiobiotin synthase [Ensifer sp. LC11]OCP04059.1 dethiobiotin synthase [Ensifer sp. LC14]OCP30978.1 dethiobiotin synthase [Ensifer sp. LC499]